MAITSTTNIITNLATGKGYFNPYIAGAGLGGTNPSATSGHIRFAIQVNSIGTTYPGTRVGIPSPGTTDILLVGAFKAIGTAAGVSCVFGRFYELGTLDLTSTGDKFMHASTFTSLQRTVFGVASTPISLIPFLYVTTALTTTAAQIILKTSAGGAGYVDQDGNNTVGTKTFIFPSATTATGSLYLPMIENDDSGVQDIVAIQVTTAAATGACVVLGFEPLYSNVGLFSAQPIQTDGIYGGSLMKNIDPATPNSGSVVSYLGYLSTTNASAANGIVYGVTN